MVGSNVLWGINSLYKHDRFAGNQGRILLTGLLYIYSESIGDDDQGLASAGAGGVRLTFLGKL